jgi:predicted dehydrogenase
MKYGLIGFGTIAAVHVKAITQVCSGRISAICDLNVSAKKEMAAALGANLYKDYRELLAKETLDAVVILTPHYSHPEISVAALQTGCHVFCEKPVAVHKNHATLLATALLHTDRVFAVNCMNRFRPDVQTVKAILDANGLGTIQAIHFVNNNWLRSSAYYRSGGWRGTWSKEGGGVLSNQSPHDLDRIIYLFGLPQEVQAHAGTSDFHRDLFVEDHVDALLFYENGMRLYFSTATHLHPGVDRMEIWGDRGYLKMENGVVTQALLPEPLETWNENNQEIFGAPQPAWTEQKIAPLSFDDLHAAGHVNFAQAIAGEARVMTPFSQAIQSVELANAMVLAGFTKERVTLPLDGEVYAEFLDGMIQREKSQTGLDTF